MSPLPGAGCSYSGLSCDKPYVFPPRIRAIHSDTSLLAFWGGAKETKRHKRDKLCRQKPWLPSSLARLSPRPELIAKLNESQDLKVESQVEVVL